MLKPSFFKLKKSNSNDCPVGNRINDEDKSTHSQTSVDEGYLKPVENTHNTKKKIKLDDGSSSGSSKTIINKLSVFSYQNSGNYKHEVRTDFRNVSSAAASYVRKEFSDRKKDIDEEGRNLSVITPLETQIMELKQQYYDMILLIQNAYKYTFFGEDAVIASQVLHITLSHAFNIPMAIVPTIRLHVHLQRLVDEGYTIGVVNEVESLGLKSGGDNKKDIYERHLLHVFSKASLRGQDVSSVFTNTSVIWGGTSANYIMCLTESCTSDGIPTIGFTAFDPTTCDMVCDVFIDDYRRNGIDKRLEHLKPSEVIVSDNISLNTLQLILHSCVVVEKLPAEMFDFTSSLVKVSTFFAEHKVPMAVALNVDGVDMIHPCLISCVAVMLIHLEKYGLQVSLLKNGVRGFTDKEHTLQLDASVLRNLELFHSKSDHGTSAYNISLYSVLNHTRTPFGARLLHEWISNPVRDLNILLERQNIIDELLKFDMVEMELLIELLSDIPDLERGISSVLTLKCTLRDCFKILEVMNNIYVKLNIIYSELKDSSSFVKFSIFILKIIDQLKNTSIYLEKLNVAAAQAEDKLNIFKDMSHFPNLVANQAKMQEKLHELDEIRKKFAKLFGLSTLDYVAVAGQEYLIELDSSIKIPGSWRVISRTKDTTRYRAPEVDNICIDLSELHEMISCESDLMWQQFLSDLNSNYFLHKAAVRSLATLDILLGFSEVAKKNKYCRPVLINEDEVLINIEDGKHPILSFVPSRYDEIVPNDTQLKGSGIRCMTISGPNMGGKSCYIRQVALIVIMAHVGSFVPAKSATISILDAIYTRMGIKDDFCVGKSTLLMELEEMNFIVQSATCKSLVLIDELCRGTATNDGTCIALATFRHLLTQVQCLMLFVTHYPLIMHSTKENSLHSENYHVTYIINEQGNVMNKVVLLYKLKIGSAIQSSYGLNVARLAGIPNDILQRAADMSVNLINKETVRDHTFENFECIMSSPEEFVIKQFSHHLPFTW